MVESAEGDLGVPELIAIILIKSQVKITPNQRSCTNMSRLRRWLKRERCGRFVAGVVSAYTVGKKALAYASMYVVQHFFTIFL